MDVFRNFLNFSFSLPNRYVHARVLENSSSCFDIIIRYVVRICGGKIGARKLAKFRSKTLAI